MSLPHNTPDVSPTVTNAVRTRREAAGLAQATLAQQVGVSRQALIAIEAGRQIPSTALALLLARALSCRVEELFQLTPDGTLQAALAPQDVHLQPTATSRVVVGKVGGRWVAHRLGADTATAADGVLTGFVPSRARRSSTAVERATIQALTDVERLEKNVLVAGCAPVLGLLANRANRHYRDTPIAWLGANSQRALELLRNGLVHVAGLHSVDDATGEVAPVARRALPGRSLTLIHLTRWRQGLVVQKSNPLRLHSAQDLLRPDLRLARREAGSGADQLLCRLLHAAGATPQHVHPTRWASSHDSIAQLVRYGVVDAGIAIESVARAADLDFVPLAEERFELVVPTELLGHAPTQRALDLLSDAWFRQELLDLPGYDATDSGRATHFDATP